MPNDRLISAVELLAQAAEYRQKAASLLRVAESLEATASLMGGETNSLIAAESHSKTRLEEIRAFLRDHGPMRRRDLLKHTNIPPGTVGVYLTDRFGFKRDSRGFWSLKDVGKQ